MKGKDVESLTKLLKQHNVSISAVKANKLLLSIGFMEEATRESSTRPGVIKKYKVLVGKGLDYGVNEENPQSPDQTSPYYCLLYTSPSPRDLSTSRMPSSA